MSNDPLCFKLNRMQTACVSNSEQFNWNLCSIEIEMHVGDTSICSV